MTNYQDTMFDEHDVTFRIKCARMKNRITAFLYEVRAYFLPYNVVKIHNSPRTWSDRVDILFHAMFQILVDYIEIEQPYLDFDQQKPGRLDDVLVHVNGVEQRYNPALNKNDDSQKGYYEKAYPDHKAIIDLYVWYKARKWAYDDCSDWDQELAHTKLCDAKLHEIVKYRAHYWT